MSDPSTRERLLDSAEKLFSQHGFSGTSLRAVTADAGTNLAAVNYHFGSKGGLLIETLRRRVDPVNRERLRRLDLAIAEAPDGIPPVERIVDAFVRPPLEAFGRPGQHLGLIRIVYEESVIQEDFVRELFGEVAARFRILGRALPHLSEGELNWRFHLMIRAMLASVAGGPATALTCGRSSEHDAETTIRRLVRFLTAGLLAPAEESAPQTTFIPERMS